MSTSVPPVLPIAPAPPAVSNTAEARDNTDNTTETIDTSPDFSTTRWAYIQLYLLAKMMRAGTVAGNTIGRWAGLVGNHIPPQDYFFVPSSKGDRRILVNVHRNQAALKNLDKPSAVHFNWHGSGWILPGLGQNFALIRYLLDNTLFADHPLTILDCDYAKAPELPCPSEAEDARDVYDYILQHSEKYNLDLNKVTMGGFSAGGTIAMGLSVTISAETRAKLKDEERFVHPIKAVIAFYAKATWAGVMTEVPPPPTPKERKELVGMLMPRYLFEPIYKMYLFPPTFAPAWSTSNAVNKEAKEKEKERRETLKRRPDVSPAEADLRNFPPHVVLYTCQYDHLAPELNVLRDRLKEVDGIKLYGQYVMGVGHGWDMMVREGQFGYEEKELAYSTVAQIIAKAGGISPTV